MFTGATLLVLLVIAGSLWWLIFEVRLSRRERHVVNHGMSLKDAVRRLESERSGSSE